MVFSIFSGRVNRALDELMANEKNPKTLDEFVDKIKKTNINNVNVDFSKNEIYIPRFGIVGRCRWDYYVSIKLQAENIETKLETFSYSYNSLSKDSIKAKKLEREGLHYAIDVTKKLNNLGLGLEITINKKSIEFGEKEIKKYDEDIEKMIKREGFVNDNYTKDKL